MRPERTTRKRIVVIESDSDSSVSDHSSKKIKKRKPNDDSDKSFCIEEEEKKLTKSRKVANKPVQKVEKKSRKKTKLPQTRKRIKKEKSEEQLEENSALTVKIEDEDTLEHTPAKRIKKDPLLEIKTDDKEIFNVKQEYVDKPIKKENTTGYNNSKEDLTNHCKSEDLSGSKFPCSDWICINPECRNSNFSWRKECNRCGAHKPVYFKEEKEFDEDDCKSKAVSSTKLQQNDWICFKSECRNSNFSWRKECNRCGAQKPDYPKDEKDLVEDIKLTTFSAKQCKTESKGKLASSSTSQVHFQPNPNESEIMKECRLVSMKSNIPFNIVSNIVNLLNNDSTIPFIVRYRSHLTGGLSAEEIRQVKHHYDSVKKVIEKGKNIKKKLNGLGYLDETLTQAIDSCVSTQDLEYIYEPFKVLKSSKLVKVIDMGLSTPAENILNGKGIVNLEQYTTSSMSLNEVVDLIIYYVGEMMSKDNDLLDHVRKLKNTERIFLNCKQKKVPENKKVPDKNKKKQRHEDVYSNYYSFSCPYSRVRPHQILAINRGEAEHCLQVTLDIPNSFQHKLTTFARNKWYFRRTSYELRENIFNKALEFMYNKRVCPHIKRQIRTELTKQGEKASLEVFSSNLKYLLLTPPIRNVIVCAIDPGYSHGCKIAILNPQQEILKTDVLYLNNPQHFGFNDCRFAKYLNELHVDLLVVGNGKGCRDVEYQISNLITSKCLNKELKYMVRSECGISVYSCSPEAKEEYPDLSPNIISAISLAKRTQDPLCELVKVEPKHLGVGMYQHDINEKKLDSVLDDVVLECVSIVGVDINNAPLRILKRVAGLSDSRAKAIIERREKEGSFMNREDLKKVKGIGPKTFQQCAGFIKIIPGVVKTERGKLKINYFDQTIIHPEDYAKATKILQMNNIKPEQIGTAECVSRLNDFVRRENLNELAEKLSMPSETLKLILDSLTKPLDYDIRSTFNKPLFRNKATSIEDLVVDTIISGQVENVTHFGAFIDLGIDVSGLIPCKFMQGRDLHLGQIVKVKISEIDTRKMRISLCLINIESDDNK